MSMTDEGTRPSNEPTTSENPETTSSGQNGAGQPAQGLPGLAGFGQMQGYAPVTEQPQQTEAPVEHAVEPELPAELHENNFTQDFAHEPQVYAEHIEPAQAMDSTGAEPSYASDDLHGHVIGQNEPQAEAFQNINPSEFEAGALHPEPAYHGDAAHHVDPAYQGEAGGNLQTFEAHYDQHPEIPLGAFEGPGEPQADQPFFHEPMQEGDAEFPGGEVATEVAAPKERRLRKILMASSGLIGVLALGGALAFAYKIGGDSDIASTGKPPLIQADSRPVKVAPEKPGGKQFPHKNKKIYERLQGEKNPEVEKLVSRQEDVAAAATAALGNAKPAKIATAQQAPASPTGVPRKVKTLTVRPDGTIVASNPRQKVVKAPAAPVAPSSNPPDGTVAMTFPKPLTSKQPAVAAPVPGAVPVKKTVTPSIPKPVAVTPPPVQKPQAPRTAPPAPAQQRVASAPAAAPAVSGGSYVVQVAARKSQTDALAAFADIQQKYPRLLSGYRPIIKRADLGSKGVWYRLNVGPVEGKQVAASLCKSLKGSGMRSCLVRAQ